MEEKLAHLRAVTKKLGSAVVAYSGGENSTLMLKIAHEVLGDRAIGVMAVSPSLAAGEMEEAAALAQNIGAKFTTIQTTEVEDPRYQANSEARCYYCKTTVYGDLIRFARTHGFAHVIDGLNADDLLDRRPGRKAATEHGVHSPRAEVGFTKVEVRELSRRLGLPTWDKPAMACRSSRIPYGKPVTRKALEQIDRAEHAVRSLGIRQVRVRHHDQLARIEVEPEDISKLVAHREHITRALRELGYTYVSIDLDGYRMGSMNEALR